MVSFSISVIEKTTPLLLWEVLFFIKTTIHLRSITEYTNKITTQKNFKNIKAAKIHAPVKIDEMINIFFTLDCIRLRDNLTSKDKIIKISKNIKGIFLNIYKGSTFCKDEITKKINHSKSIIKLTNHK